MGDANGWNRQSVLSVIGTILNALILLEKLIESRRGLECTAMFLPLGRLGDLADRFGGESALVRDIKNKWKVPYQGQISIVNLTFRNVGAAAISPSDFHEQLSVSVPGWCEIVALEQDFLPEPSSVKVTLTRHAKNEFIVNPGLLNRRDTFTLRGYVVDTEETDLVIAARIRDVPLKIRDDVGLFQNYQRLILPLIPLWIIFGIAGDHGLIPSSIATTIAVVFILTMATLLMLCKLNIDIFWHAR